MDRKFLKELKVEGLEGGLPKEVIDEIMAEYGADFNKKDKEIETLKTEKSGIEQQLNDANEKIKSFATINVEDMKQQITDLETKYNQDTENLKKELSKKEYDYKINDLVKELKFSSNGAKKAFLNDLKEKNLEFDQDNNLVGYDDFIASYKEADPTAFVNEEGFKANTGEDHDGDNSNDDDFVNRVMGLK